MASTSFDLFLSHNSRDKAAVERIAVALRQDGFTPWLDVWDLPPGGDWQDGIEHGLRHSRGCAVFLGAAGFGDWQIQEMKVSSSLAAHDPAFRYFLVLLPGAPDLLDPATLPAFINLRGRVDLRLGFESPRQLQPLIHAVLGLAMGPSAPIAPELAESPYRGLAAFDEQHAELFFGREAEIKKLLDKLRQAPFLAVIGPSGSGKSSLVLAGLIPALRAGRLEGSVEWAIVTMVPGTHPLESLAIALGSLDPERSRTQLLEELRGSPLALRLEAGALLRSRSRSARLVLVVDQFEEIFTLCRDEAERQAFLDLLLAAAEPGGRSLVIITMRADFYPRITEYPALADQVASHQLLVGALTREGLTAAIEQPAFRKGLRFEPGLVATILADAGGDAGALPLLQYALDELWKRQHGGVLTLEGYRDSGGVGGAIATRANGVFENLSPEEQTLARRVLLRLTQPGESTEDTRRRADLDELVTRPADRPAIEAVIGALVAARLLTTGRDEATGEAQVDVAHEALIRAWPRLRQWLDEDRQGLLVQRRLTEAAQEWQRGGRDPDLLYRGGRLTDALALADQQPEALNELERSFLGESQTQREREREDAAAAVAARERLRRRVLTGLGAFSMIALLLALLAGLQWREAGRQAAEARVQSGRAEEQAAAAANAEATAQAEAARAESEAGAARTAQDEAQRQAGAAREAETTSLARAVAGQARSQGNKFDIAMLLAAEGYELAPSDLEGQRALFSSVFAHPSLKQFLYGNHDRVTAMAFSPDGALLAAGEVGGQILRWDPTTGRAIGQPFPTGQSEVSSLIFRPVQAMGSSGSPSWEFATGSETGLVQIWNLGSDPPQPRLQLQGTGQIRVLAYSPDGTRLAAASDNGEITVWNAETGQVAIPTWEAHDGIISALDYSPDGELLLSGGLNDRVVAVWGGARGEPLGELLRDQGSIGSIRFTPDGLTLAVSTSNQVLFWDPVHFLPLRTLDLGDDVGTAGVGAFMAMSGNGKVLAVADTTGTIREWRVDTGELIDVSLETGQRPVYAIALNEDGSLLATGGAESDVRLWSITLPQPELFRDPSGHRFTPASLAFSPDNITIATGDEDGAVFLWDSRTGNPIGGRMESQAGAIWSLAFSPDGTLLASASDDGTVQLWDPQTGQAASPLLGGHRLDTVDALAFSPSGSWLATGGYSSTITLWRSTGDGIELGPSIYMPDVGSILSLAFNPAESLLAAGDGTGQLILWDVGDELSNERRLDTGQIGVTALCFVEPDVIATGGGDGSIHFWNTIDNAEVNTPVAAHDSVIYTLSCDPDRRLMLSSGGDGRVRLWQYGTNKPQGEWTASSIMPRPTRRAALRSDGAAIAYVSGEGADDGQVVVQPVSGQGSKMAFPVSRLVANATLSADGTQVAAAEQDGQLEIWSAETGAEIAAGQTVDPTGLAFVAFSPDGQLVASGADDGTVRLWQSESATAIDPALGSMSSGAQILTFNDRGNMLATGDLNGDLQLWDVDTRQRLGESLTTSIPTGGRSSILSLAFSADGNLLAAGAGYDVILADVATRKMIGTPFKGHLALVDATAFSPSASQLATFDDSGQVFLWHVSPDGLSERSLLGSMNQGGAALAFSPDGSLLAAGDFQGEVAIWDIASRTQLGFVKPIAGPSIVSLIFSADGSTLTALDYGGNIYHWDLTPAAWLQRACTVANHNLTLAEWQRFIGDPDDPQRPYHKTCPSLPGPTDIGLATPAATFSTPVSA